MAKSIESYRILKKDNPDPEKIRRIFEEKSSTEIVAALANPEHSPRGIEMLSEIARERGIETGEDRLWAQSRSTMHVAPFGKQPTFAEALEAPEKRRKQVWASRAIGAALLVLAGAAFFVETGDETTGSTVAGVGVAIFILGFMPFLYWTRFFAWKNPRRILLLRPFQAKSLSKPLKRLVRKNLTHRGHTFTLADKHVKESRLMFFLSVMPKGPEDLVILPFSLLVPPLRQLHRWLNVTSPRRYEFLRNRLSRRKTLNKLSGDKWLNKIMSIKSSDEWWQQCIDLLMYSCEIIVVDLSLVKEGTEWELEKINVRDIEGKTIFVVHEEARAYAREVIADFWPSTEAPPPLFVFSDKGELAEKDVFDQTIARIVSTSHLWVAPKQTVIPFG